MIIPLQLTFRGMEPSPAISAKIHQKAERLERFHDRITTMRIVFEQLHHHHHQGNLFHVRIDLTLAGGEIVVGSEHHDKHSHEDPYVAIRDAFDALGRKLDEFVRMQEHHERLRVIPMHGTVTRVDTKAGFGRIASPDGAQIYFHKKSVDGAFEELQPGAPVGFDLYDGEGPEGLQASAVRPISRQYFPVGPRAASIARYPEI